MRVWLPDEQWEQFWSDVGGFASSGASQVINVYPMNEGRFCLSNGQVSMSVSNKHEFSRHIRKTVIAAKEILENCGILPPSSEQPFVESTPDDPSALASQVMGMFGDVTN